MALHRKCAIVLVILCTMRCVTRASVSDIRGNDVSEDSDEDEKLKQALVLVDLLKNEYVRMLKENYQLRRGQATYSEEPTCASADELTSTSQQTALTTTDAPIAIAVDAPVKKTPIPVNRPGTGRRMGGVTPHTFQKSLGKNGGFKPYKFARRRIPAAYYYSGYDYPFRRRDTNFRRHEEDLSGENETTTSITTAEDNNGLTTETGTENITTDTETATSITKTVSEEKNDNTDQEKPTTLDTTDMPDAMVKSQVAFELIQELKAKAAVRTTKKIHTDSQTPNKYLTLIKPTMKIHLSGSTPYPIPLPENHAFCYTNPNNRLCRTAI